METLTKYLYKVYRQGWSAPVYVAATNQQEAVNRAAEEYQADSYSLNVEYIDIVYV